jgi:uncharacterized protein YcbK (DUF882 family)
MNWKDLNYFSPDEFDCHCNNCKNKNTGEKYMDDDFIHKLHYSRVVSNVVYDVSNGCGYRCEAHNKNIGGSDTSLHPEGKAADIPYRNSTECLKIIYGLIQGGFKRIKVYKKNDKSGWIHVDVYKGNSKPEIWFDIKEV